MVERFQNDDAGFRRWRKGRGAGFIFNHFGGRDPGMNVLHRADCEQLVPQRAEMRWTTYAKLCSPAKAELEAAADQACGGRAGWTRCSRCNP